MRVKCPLHTPSVWRNTLGTHAHQMTSPHAETPLGSSILSRLSVSLSPSPAFSLYTHTDTHARTQTRRAQKSKDLIGDLGHGGASSLQNLDCVCVLCQLHCCVARLYLHKSTHTHTHMCVCVCLCVEGACICACVRTGGGYM